MPTHSESRYSDDGDDYTRRGPNEFTDVSLEDSQSPSRGISTDNNNDEMNTRRPASDSSSKFAKIQMALLAIAFGCMLGVAITPITSAYYIFKIGANVKILIDSVSDTFEAGVFGYCSTGVHNSFGIGKAKINSKITGGSCSDRSLLWSVDKIPGVSKEKLEQINMGLSAYFIIHFLTFLFLIPSLGGAIYAYVKHGDTYQKTLQSKKVNLIFISLAFFVGLLVFLFNAIGVPIIIAKVHGISKGKGSFSVGPAYPLVVVGTFLTIVAFIFAFMDFRKFKQANSGLQATSRY